MKVPQWELSEKSSKLALTEAPQLTMTAVCVKATCTQLGETEPSSDVQLSSAFTVPLLSEPTRSFHTLCEKFSLARS